MRLEGLDLAKNPILEVWIGEDGIGLTHGYVALATAFRLGL
jgi:hypothetical protein